MCEKLHKQKLLPTSFGDLDGLYLEMFQNVLQMHWAIHLVINLDDTPILL